MNDVLLDRLELGYLSGLQDQRVVQDRVRGQMTAGLNLIRSSGMPAAATATPSTNGAAPADDGMGGIISRSPTTNNHNHYHLAPVEPQPAPTATVAANPWPWIFASTLVIVAALSGAWWLGRERQAPVATIPSVQPGQYRLGLDDLQVF